MQPNPNKFQAIFFGPTAPCDVYADTVLIEPSTSIKLLGVTLDDQLTFSEHISNICVKAGRHINVLKRIGKSLPLHVKLLIYRTYIACHFSFCPLVWHFCSVANTQKLERMQYRALRYVYDDHDSDYDVLLNRANMPTLELARLRLLCIEVFKAINNISPPYMCNLFKLHDKQDHNTRSVKLLIQNHYNKVTYGKKTFVCFSTHLWNNLPTHVRKCNSIDEFKVLINTWYGPECKCNFCRSTKSIK